MKKNIIIFIAVIIIGVLGFMLYQENSEPQNGKQYPSRNTAGPAVSEEEQITNVVRAFMNSTLGTLSGGQVSLETAKAFTTNDFAQNLTDISAIPRIYGIQQGPQSINVNEPLYTGPTVSVRVEGLWGGEVGQSWIFDLEKDSGGAWKISGITPVL